ncbi:hypothetical protein ACFP3U_23755 [Kitasatospora misakiensis]|uniref:Condensation domain-containing protein n=1 Tax=Kitasatospora misakiensis TaxID=67330 RepID=A0ABW0XBR8_9ACTN
MNPGPAPARRELAFHADNGGTFTTTWGQRYIRAEIQRVAPADEWNRQFRCYLPPGEDGPVTVDHALAIVRTLIERHVALRTRFRLDPLGGVAEQIVDAGGRIGVDIIAEADPDRCEEALSAHLNAWTSQPFDLEWDTPVRIALGVCGAGAHLIGIVAPHVNLDGAGTVAVVEDLHRIIAGRTPEPVVFDPLAAAAEESGASGRERSRRALELMRPAIQAAADNPLRTARHSPATPMAQAASLSTDPFQSAHEYLARKLALFASGAITLVAAATAIHRVLGVGRTVFKVECANRWSPTTRSYIGHRAQPIYIAAAGDTGDTAAEIRAVDRAIRTAARHCPHDPDAVQALIEEAGADTSIFFNDLRALATDPAPHTPRPDLADAFLHPDDEPPAMPLIHHDPNTVDSGPHRIKMAMHLTSHEDRLTLSLAAEDIYLDATEVSALLHEIGRTVIDLAREQYRSADGALRDGA